MGGSPKMLGENMFRYELNCKTLFTRHSRKYESNHVADAQ